MAEFLAGLFLMVCLIGVVYDLQRIGHDGELCTWSVLRHSHMCFGVVPCERRRGFCQQALCLLLGLVY